VDTCQQIREKMAEQDNNIVRRRFSSVLEPLNITNNSGIFGCCFEFFQPRNKILPTVIQPGNCEFVEINPQRRLRIINIAPTDEANTKKSDNNCFAQDEGKVVESESELSEEEYWFENAAPNRLPVIQPLPQPQQSRIINKFEPQESSQVGTPKNLEDDVISPGRLPRKSISTRAIDLETDDYEDDEETVNTSIGDDSPSARKQLSGALSSGLEHMSEMILEITAEGTERRRSPARGSPVNPSPASSRSESPLSPSQPPVQTMISSTRIIITPPPLPLDSPPRSPSPKRSELADDSCHPSPEIPHRAVCAVPNPINQTTIDNTPLVISGGNLGGVANQGFNDDEENDENDFDTDTASGATIEATNPAVIENNEVDAGYARNRDLNSFLDNQLKLIPSNKENESPNLTETSLNATKAQDGSNELPILFFLHGVGGSADIWSSQLAFFVSHGYQVVAPDMLGHGFSSCPDKAKAYTFTKLFKDILTIFDAYVTDNRKCIVFGHSYGCSFTIALARTRAEKISTLVMIASGGPTPLAPPPNISKYPKCIVDCFRRLLECKFKNQQQKYNPRGKTIKFKEAFDVPSYVFQHVMAGQAWPEGDAGFHRRVTVPTLLVYGMRDTLVSLVEECEMERTLPKAYLELIPTAGHCVMLDTPQELNTMALKFIKKWTSINSTNSLTRT